MPKDLLNIFNELEDLDTRDKILKPPFLYHGSKSKSVQHILPHLPHYDTFIDVFGGSGSVLLSRKKSKLEVFNDRNAGITCFYKCLRDKEKMNRMIEWLDLTLCSREEFNDCRDSWKDTYDDVERAAKWYYMVMYSFGAHGRNFGRSITANCTHGGRIHKRLELFPEIHERMRYVQIENMDFERMMLDYDSSDTVFYLDPPYLEVYSAYRGTELFTYDDHLRLLKLIFKVKGFVALSGYRNDLYKNFPFDNYHEFEATQTARSSNRSDDSREYRDKVTECLWIKEAY